MNKELYKKFSQYIGLDNDPCPIPDPAPVQSESDFDKILNTIFSVDSRTGLPMTDISYYMSPNGDPQVKEWIINNLLKPRASATGQTIDGALDDLAHEFSRGSTETVDQYRERLAKIRDDAEQFLASQKEEEK